MVKPEWVTGKAMFRIPWLGHVRLTFDKLLGGTAAPMSPSSTTQGSIPAPASAGPGATGFGPDGSLAGAAAIAGTGAGAAVAIGRHRN